MLQMKHRQTTALRELATLGPAAAVLGGLLLVMALGDVYPSELMLALAAVLALQVLPGVLVWRSVRPVDGSIVEDLTMGLAIGAAMAVPVQVATVASGMGALAYAAPLAITAALLGVRPTRVRILSRRVTSLPWWWGVSLSATFAAGVASFLGVLVRPVRWVGYAERYIDRGFHEGLVGELLHRFPIRYPHVASEEVAYHWFSHAWNASIAATSGVSIDVLLWRFTPALIHVAGPLLLAVVVVRLSGRAWTGPLAATVAYLANNLEPWHAASVASPWAPESPSQEFATLVYPALLAVIGLRWRGSLGRGNAVLLLLLLLVAAGTKGTSVSVLIPGLVLAAVAMALLDRRKLPVVLTDLGLAVGVFVFTTAVIFGGETKNLEIVPLEWMTARTEMAFGVDASPWTAQGLALVALGLLPKLLVAATVVAAACTRSGRRDPLLWLFVGASCAGVGALLLFVQVAQSHIYFYKISLIPFGMAAAYAAGLLAKGRRPVLPVTLGLAAGIGAALVLVIVQGIRGSDPTQVEAWLSLGFTVLLVLLVCGLVLRRRGAAEVALASGVGLIAAATVGPVVHVAEYEQLPRTESEDQVARHWVHASDARGLRWLRDHSDPDDLVATNRHCRARTVESCDTRRFFVAAYSERRVLVEGWAYTPKADAQYDPDTGRRWKPFWDAELIKANDTFFTDPDAAGREELRERGVRWLVLDDQAPHADSLEPWAELRHRTRHLSIYELVTEPG